MPLVPSHLVLPTLTFQYDVATARWTWSRGLRELHGLRASEEATTERLLEHMHKDDRIVMIGRFAHHLENIGPYSCTYRMRDSAGEQRRLIFVGQSEAEHGEIRRLRGFVVDITEPAREFGRQALASATRRHSAVEQAKGALMLAFNVDDDAASGLLRAHAHRQGRSTAEVAGLIVEGLAQPGRDPAQPAAVMAEIAGTLPTPEE